MGPALWFVDPDESLGFLGLETVAERAGLEIGGRIGPEVNGGPRPPDGALVVSNPARMPGGVVGAERLVRELDRCRHVALTHRRDEPFVLRVLRGGYEGFLLFSTPVEETEDALRRLASGEGVVTGILASRVAISGARLADTEIWPGATHGLTRRESEVLEWVSHGETTKSIAERLFVGEETIRSHLKSLYQKLGVSDRSAAVAKAFRGGILSPDLG
jgi:DNA-binding NarL/FixJ family response regulator